MALWHTAYNVTSATAVTDGLPAALTSTVVMVSAVVIVIDTLHRPVTRRPPTDPSGPFDPDAAGSRAATLEA